jgi:hypothetical protein
MTKGTAGSGQPKCPLLMFRATRAWGAVGNNTLVGCWTLGGHCRHPTIATGPLLQGASDGGRNASFRPSTLSSILSSKDPSQEGPCMTCTSYEHTPLPKTSEAVSATSRQLSPFTNTIFQLQKPLTGGLLHDVYLTRAHAIARGWMVESENQPTPSDVAM